MPSTSYIKTCPKCKSKDSLMCSFDKEPYDAVCGQCLECGFYYFTKEKHLDLDAVNIDRRYYGLKKLKKLKPQL